MKEIPVETWSAFHAAIAEAHNILGGRRDAYLPAWADTLFRGQRSSTWELDTTMERHRSNSGEDTPAQSMLGYLRQVAFYARRLRSLVGHKFDLPELPQDMLVNRTDQEGRVSFSPMMTLQPEVFSYLVYLRHHGYPSPLLDWSRSPYVAAYFALADARPANGPLAVWAFRARPDGVGGCNSWEPSINDLYDPVAAPIRHYSQQSAYTLASLINGNDYDLVSHERAFGSDTDSQRQNVFVKIVLSESVIDEGRRWLASVNINAYTLMGTEDALVSSFVEQDLITAQIERHARSSLPNQDTST